ncbi:MAG: DNA mismatch endonuclease Vsr [Opitutales bacterium]|nr:DNA mismatch endonuclease Vsr [Opitutales bacterium]
MVDTVSEEQRSYNMSRIRSKDTKPEILIRSMLHGLGYRFTVNGPKNRQLPGKPDIVLPKYGTVIFVHGCFWHGHEGCKDFRLPKTRTDWWRAKIDRNRSRDARNLAAVRALGWRALVIWSCEFNTAAKLEALRAGLSARIGLPMETAEERAVAEPAAPYGKRRAKNR